MQTGKTAIDAAAANGHVGAVRLLIEHGAFVSIHTLLAATAGGHAGVLALLLSLQDAPVCAHIGTQLNGDV